MNRRLIVMRHAKSSWSTPGQNDHDRPLNKRGRKDAVRVAARLTELGWFPEMAVSSSAARTRETFDLMEPMFDASVDVDFMDGLYHAGIRELRNVLRNLPDDVQTVLALGHNPGWEGVIAWLSGEGLQLTTANAALLTGTGATWADALAEAESWNLCEIIRPKEL